MLVRDIMKSPVVVAECDATLASTYSLMREHGIRHVPVVRQGKLVGVVTDRDLRLATSALSTKPFSPKARIEKVMSQPAQTADPLDPVEEAARTMRQLKIGCLPVMSGADLVGIVTGLDLLDALLRLTGVSMPSGRLEVGLPDHPGELARLAAFLAAKQVNIRSILSHADADDRIRLVLRVGTIELKVIAQELRTQGFEVLWPALSPW
ncbi:MAG: CBS and ACT domain-containing protein [Acidobacteriia bacterium]|nr:CBS and ACT domain-containing protein [Terriglobia bacterium]